MTVEPLCLGGKKDESLIQKKKKRCSTFLRKLKATQWLQQRRKSAGNIMLKTHSAVFLLFYHYSQSLQRRFLPTFLSLTMLQGLHSYSLLLNRCHSHRNLNDSLIVLLCPIRPIDLKSNMRITLCKKVIRILSHKVGFTFHEFLSTSTRTQIYYRI